MLKDFIILLIGQYVIYHNVLWRYLELEIPFVGKVITFPRMKLRIVFLAVSILRKRMSMVSRFLDKITAEGSAQFCLCRPGTYLCPDLFMDQVGMAAILLNESTPSVSEALHEIWKVAHDNLPEYACPKFIRLIANQNLKTSMIVEDIFSLLIVRLNFSI